jgi:aminodeoxyfutalosine synthase
MPANLDSLFPVVESGRSLTVTEASAVATCPDLVAVGVLGEASRKAVRGNRVTYARVAVVPVAPTEPQAASRGAAVEVRIAGRAASIDQACARVEALRAWADGATLTGFSSADLLDLADQDLGALSALVRRLAEAGLDAVAETPVDRLNDVEQAVEVIRTVRHAGLGLWRLTVDQATPSALDERITLIERAAVVAGAVGDLLAFAPLPRKDPRDVPSTGYDDVKTVAIARLMCRSVPSIQIDWTLYGPKLAQVAIAYGADDLDAISPYDDPAMGPRRAPAAEIERHIRAAFAEPAERTARYELRS